MTIESLLAMSYVPRICSRNPCISDMICVVDDGERAKKSRC
jgi:hypothetical protein